MQQAISISMQNPDTTPGLIPIDVPIGIESVILGLLIPIAIMIFEFKKDTDAQYGEFNWRYHVLLTSCLPIKSLAISLALFALSLILWESFPYIAYLVVASSIPAQLRTIYLSIKWLYAETNPSMKNNYIDQCIRKYLQNLAKIDKDTYLRIFLDIVDTESKQIPQKMQTLYIQEYIDNTIDVTTPEGHSYVNILSDYVRNGAIGFTNNINELIQKLVKDAASKDTNAQVANGFQVLEALLDGKKIERSRVLDIVNDNLHNLSGSDIQIIVKRLVLHLLNAGYTDRLVSSPAWNIPELFGIQNNKNIWNRQAALGVLSAYIDWLSRMVSSPNQDTANIDKVTTALFGLTIDNRMLGDIISLKSLRDYPDRKGLLKWADSSRPYLNYTPVPTILSPNDFIENKSFDDTYGKKKDKNHRELMRNTVIILQLTHLIEIKQLIELRSIASEIAKDTASPSNRKANIHRLLNELDLILEITNKDTDK